MIEAVLDKTTAVRVEWGDAADARLTRIARGAAAPSVPHIAFARPWTRTAPAAKPASADIIDTLPAREKAAFTLRLDPIRHARLKQACTSSRRSAQQVVTEALDAFLAAKSGSVRAAGAAIRSGEF